MLRSLLYVIILIFITFSCKNSQEDSKYESSNIFYNLDNKILENEIDYYKDSISQQKQIINISVRSLDDTTYYEIRGALNGCDIIEKPSTFFVNTETQIITISYVNSDIIFKEIEGVKISEKQAWDILKDYYSEEYVCYLHRDVFVAKTGGGVVWCLKFVNQKYVGKKVFTER